MKRPASLRWFSRLLDDTNAWYGHVQHVEYAGKTWSAATDRRIALFMQDNGQLAGDWIRYRGGHVEEDSERRMATALRRPTEFAYSADLDDLRLWLGPRRIEKCPGCASDARPQRRHCTFCSGEGWVYPLSPLVRLYQRDEWFYRDTVLSSIPKRLPRGKITVSLVQNEVAVARIDGPGWIAMVAAIKPINDPVPGTQEVFAEDRFSGSNRIARNESRRYVPGIGALSHLWGGPDENILRDWCEERGHDLYELNPIQF